MKFGKQLQHLQSTLDTQSIPTLHYKGLKKLLKAEGPPQAGIAQAIAQRSTRLGMPSAATDTQERATGTGSPSELGDLPHSAAHPTSAQQVSRALRQSSKGHRGT